MGSEWADIARLWVHIEPRRRVQFSLLLLLMVAASVAEIVSIGVVVPFLAVLTSPERIFEHPAAQPLIEAFGWSHADQLLLPLAVGFCLAAVFAGGMRVMLTYVSIRLAFSTGTDLSNEVYRRTLYQPYEVHVARNSSEVIAGIVSKVNSVIYHVITPVLTLLSSATMAVAILLVLIAINPVVSLSAFVGFGLIYALIIALTKRRKLENGRRMARESTRQVKNLQEGLGGVRDVLLDGTQPVYCRNYREADYALRRAQGMNQFVTQSPRFIVEALGMVLIAGLAYVLAYRGGGNLTEAIPLLGVLALGAQRLLPIMQHAYAAWSTIQGHQAMLKDALLLLEQPLPQHAFVQGQAPIRFEQQIELKQVSFRYANCAPLILKDLSLRIAKGDRVGFIGQTGSGKSTLLDLVMGLLRPTEGCIEIDGQPVDKHNVRAWQQRIAHIPQAIFLADSTIEQNIAFGIAPDEIDPARVRWAAQQAKIADDIESWPDQYATNVGERGVRMSGGQRQRIGIARALYKQADVLVLDEATSALDSATEIEVMASINALQADITVLIIAHRLSTLKCCSRLVELAGGSIARVGAYSELVEAAVEPVPPLQSPS